MCKVKRQKIEICRILGIVSFVTLAIWDEQEKSETQLQYATFSAKCLAVEEKKKQNIPLGDKTAQS